MKRLLVAILVTVTAGAVLASGSGVASAEYGEGYLHNFNAPPLCAFPWETPDPSVPICLATFFAPRLTLASQSAPTGPIAAAAKPSLDIFPEDTRLGRSALTDLEISRPSGTGEFAQFSIFVPAGFDLGLSRGVGTRVGALIAWEVSGLPHVGTITVDDPAKHTADTCSPGAHLAVWLLAPAGLPQLPAYIDQTTGSETALGGYKLVICVPSSTTTGLTLDQFDIAPTLTNPSSAALYMWRVFVTPYAATAPNPSGAYELRSREPLPVSLSLSGRYRKGRALLSGRLVTPAAPTTGIFINLFTQQTGHFRFTAYTRTRAGGRYWFSRRIRAATRFYAEVASYRDCQEATVAPAGCVSETMVSVSSPTVSVRVRRR